ncbi:MAG: GNAT family N-acetyltransferase [Eubacteriales bacterium]|nr:GNAT family N-acetyltransferase [Eubacteriales bacterium]
MRLEIELLAKEYEVRRIREEDVAEVYRLCVGNPLYYEYCPPKVTEESIREDLRALPPGVSEEEKYYVGFYREGKLLAVMDLIAGYPEEEIGFIGFFMVEKAVQGRNVGSEIVEQACGYLGKRGFRAVRLAWVKGNPQAEHFWRKNGFGKIGESLSREEEVVLAEKRLRGLKIAAADLETLSKAELQRILLKMQELLSEEQLQKLQKVVEESRSPELGETLRPYQERMSQELVDEKMSQIIQWQKQIDEGELYLDTEEYEDYSSGYWDADWVTEYFDNYGIGDKILFMIQFAKDCVDDRKYQEAHEIYGWLWEMEVLADQEYSDPVDLETMAEQELLQTDLKQLALLTLYAEYQVLEPEKRAEGLYRYFSYGAFSKLHVEEMFRSGRENLKDTERFWKEWIALLKEKNGDVEARLLEEAVLYQEGIEGLARLADENAAVHPSLYLAVMEEYQKGHRYQEIEETGKRAVKILDDKLVIRAKAALTAAAASSYLQHEEEVMRFCWECFRSDSNVKNYLRLFGTKEMADKYGMRGREVLENRSKGNSECGWRNTELYKNVIGDSEYYRLSFYMGDFETVKTASKNPKGSLGWSSSFIKDGIRLFLLYLYEEPLPSKAAASTAAYVGFPDTEEEYLIGFEKKIQEESRERKLSEFWNYFQRWKSFFPMEDAEKKRYLGWAERIVYSRADAIVSGQHRNHYGQAAVLLAMIGEIKEGMGIAGAARSIFAEYKRKFPRHSSFQREMKYYFSEV